MIEKFGPNLTFMHLWPLLVEKNNVGEEAQCYTNLMGHPLTLLVKGIMEKGPGFSLSVMNALPADVSLSKLYLAMLWN